MKLTQLLATKGPKCRMLALGFAGAMSPGVRTDLLILIKCLSSGEPLGTNWG